MLCVSLLRGRIYVYARHYPKVVAFDRVMKLRGEESYCRRRWYSTVVPFLMAIADSLSAGEGEIRWGDRLNPLNHSESFPVSVTTIVDTLPVVVQQPEDPVLRRCAPPPC